MPQNTSFPSIRDSERGFAPILIVVVAIVILGSALLVFKPWTMDWWPGFSTQINNTTSKNSADNNKPYIVKEDILRTKLATIYAKKATTIQVIDEQGVVISIIIAANTLKKDQQVQVRPLKSDPDSQLLSGIEISPSKLKLSQNADIVFDFSHTKLASVLGDVQKRSVFLLDSENNPIPLFTSAGKTGGSIIRAKLTKTGVVVADATGNKQLAAGKTAFKDQNTGTFSIIEAAKIYSGLGQKLNDSEKAKYNEAVQKITSKKDIYLPILATIVQLKKNAITLNGIIPQAFAEDDLEQRLKDEVTRICTSDDSRLSDYIVSAETAEALGDNQLAQDCRRKAEDQAEKRISSFESNSTLTFESGLTFFAEVSIAFPENSAFKDRVFKKLEKIALQELQSALSSNTLSLTQMFEVLIHAKFMNLDSTLIQQLTDKMKSSLKSEFERIAKTVCPEPARINYLIDQASYFNFTDLVNEFSAKKDVVTKCATDDKLMGKKDGKNPPVLPPSSSDPYSPRPSASVMKTVIYGWHYSWNWVGDEIYEACYDEYTDDDSDPQLLGSWCCQTSIWADHPDPLCERTSPQAYGAPGTRKSGEDDFFDNPGSDYDDTDLPIEPLPESGSNEEDLPLEPIPEKSESSDSPEDLPIEPLPEDRTDPSGSDTEDPALTLPGSD